VRGVEIDHATTLQHLDLAVRDECSRSVANDGHVRSEIVSIREGACRLGGTDRLSFGTLGEQIENRLRRGLLVYRPSGHASA
jgi:hypothetical protein